jgi:Phenylalanyl-tRNA synthetase alpha subunit
VLKSCGYNPEKWSGFAFGGGIERFAMMLYGISDLRVFYENDLRILQQVK